MDTAYPINHISLSNHPKEVRFQSLIYLPGKIFLILFQQGWHQVERQINDTPDCRCQLVRLNHVYIEAKRTQYLDDLFDCQYKQIGRAHADETKMDDGEELEIHVVAAGNENQ